MQIANDPACTLIEIVHQRSENQKMKRELAKALLQKDMKDNGVNVSKKEGKRIRAAINHMSPVIEYSLETAGDKEV